MSPGSSVRFHLNQSEESATITVYVDGVGKPVTDSQPIFEQVKAKALAGDESVYELLNAAESAAKKLYTLTDRITARHGALYLDGDLLDGPLATKVLEFWQEGVDDWKPLALFAEKISANPSDNSRKQLYGWLDANKVTLTPEGDIVCYKGMNKHESVVGEGENPCALEVTYTPSYQGVVFVERDGEVIEFDDKTEAHQKVGDVVTMPRSVVKDDPLTACHTGLHVANLRFARTFCAATLEVHVNPRDVVSVPYDDSDKIRCCRYEIVGEYHREEPYQQAVLTEQPEEASTEDDEHEIDTLADYHNREVEAYVSGSAASGVLPESEAFKPQHPSEAEFETMQKRAKRRRRNFEKYATKQGPWTLVGDDPKSRLSWVKN